MIEEDDDCEDQGLAATTVCTRFECAHGIGSAPALVRYGGYWICPRCRASYGENPHPTLRQPMETAEERIARLERERDAAFEARDRALDAGAVALRQVKVLRGIGLSLTIAHEEMLNVLSVTAPEITAMPQYARAREILRKGKAALGD